MKYATIVKCEPTMLFKIFYQVYKNNMDQEFLTRMEFEHFVNKNRDFMETVPYFSQSNVTKENFIDLMQTSGFKVSEYQKKLVITTEDDVPFQAITNEIHECDFNDLVQGRWYYLISEAWF